MVLLLLLFLGLVTCIYYVKQQSWHTVLRVSHRISGKPHIGIWLYAFFFFPGTLLHELSHLFVAEILRVKTGEINLFPAHEEGYVTFGSVHMVRADPVRRLLIGSAPFFVGIVVISTITLLQFASLQAESVSVSTVLADFFKQLTQPLTWFSLYLIVVLSHSMFPSEVDRQEIFLVPIFILITGIFLWLFRGSILVPEGVASFFYKMLFLLDIALACVLVFNAAFHIVLASIKRGFEKVF